MISVIIPVYNVENYLERCVESVMRQTYGELEVILVNDGSTDGSLEVCKQLQKKYSQIIIIDKENGGVSSARNRGIDFAHGDYITFLDSDDWVAPDCYGYMIDLLINNDADISDIMPYQTVSEDENLHTESEKIEVFEGRDILEHYLYRGMSEKRGAPYAVWRKMYKYSLLEGDSRYFDEGIVNEDICFNYRILRKASKVVVSNQIKYFYFQGDKSTTIGAIQKKDLSLITVSNELVRLAEESRDEKIIELAKMKEARSYFSLLARIAKYGIDEDSINDPKILTMELKVRLRERLPILMRSPMSVERKILAFLFACNYEMCYKIINIMKSCK